MTSSRAGELLFAGPRRCAARAFVDQVNDVLERRVINFPASRLARATPIRSPMAVDPARLSPCSAGQIAR
jgi:hypothetical protein